jgi:signal peptidase II
MGDRRLDRHPDRSPGRREADHAPLRGLRPIAVIAICIALADWASKLAVTLTIPLEALHEVVPGRLAFWHVRNPAMVLGLWENFPLGTRKVIAILAAVLGSLVLVQILGRGQRFPRHQRAWAWVFVGLVLGGMMGNLGERVLHWWVTDFISLRYGEYWLPPGNLADLALFLSMPLSIPVMAFELMGRSRRALPHVEASVVAEAVRESAG